MLDTRIAVCRAYAWLANIDRRVFSDADKSFTYVNATFAWCMRDIELIPVDTRMIQTQHGRRSVAKIDKRNLGNRAARGVSCSGELDMRLEKSCASPDAGG